jgi:hypothetical protein
MRTVANVHAVVSQFATTHTTQRCINIGLCTVSPEKKRERVHPQCRYVDIDTTLLSTFTCLFIISISTFDRLTLIKSYVRLM